MRTDGFVGNAAAVALVGHYVDSGRMPHALLIEGPKGSGRRTLARLIARAAVCTGAGEKPCGECPNCRKALAGVHPDISWTEGEGKSHTVSVKTVRALREDVFIRPNEAPRRVIGLIEAQDMNEAGQNALLKVLEEPPAHALFLLTCENRSQLLETVRSRAVSVSLGGVSEEEALPLVLAARPGIGEEEARRALRLFGGVIGQAIGGLRDGDLTAVTDKTAAFARAITGTQELELARLTATMDKDLWDGVLRGIQLAARDVAADKCGGAAAQSPSPEATAALGGLTGRQAMALIDTVTELMRCRRRYMNPTLFSVVAASRLRQAAGK
ncbi:MAG: hypothetical protein ACOYJY_04970 [Acutalibacteraceae bacterium]|jgi:DNA polymerase-3 subunit delta'